MQETEKYANELRLLTSITGEDAKAKMQQAKDAANNLAFQNKLAEMAPDQARAIEKAMAGMTKQQQKDFMEMQVFGTVVNKTGAIMMATNKGYSASVSELDEKARNSSLTLEEVAKTNSKFREQTLADRKAEIGRAHV